MTIIRSFCHTPGHIVLSWESQCTAVKLSPGEEEEEGPDLPEAEGDRGVGGLGVLVVGHEGGEDLAEPVAEMDRLPSLIVLHRVTIQLVQNLPLTLI